MLHQRDRAFDRPQVGWRRLSVAGAIVDMRLGASLVIASEHQRAPAEPRPDFSGQWVLESASTPGSEVARTLAVEHSARQTAARGGSVISPFEWLTIERDGSVAESHQIGIVGGVVSGTVAGKDADGRPLGPVSTYAVKWDGNMLVFESESHGQTAADPWTERREVWLLDEAGRLRIIINSRNSEGTRQTLTLLYRRR